MLSAVIAIAGFASVLPAVAAEEDTIRESPAKKRKEALRATAQQIKSSGQKTGF